MKTIIHIGQHKTATTSIQAFLSDNKIHFENIGIYIPSTIGGFEDPSHFALNIYSLDEDRYSSKKEEILRLKGRQYYNRLINAVESDVANIYLDASRRGCNTVIWSNEGLYLLNSVTEYKKLYNLFSGYSDEICMVCCFRDVVSYRNSYIKQLAKQKVPTSNNPDSYRYIEPDSWIFNYKRKKSLLDEVFDYCIFFSYDQTDNVKKFAQAIGLSSIQTKKYRYNVTKSVSLLKRIKNTLFHLLIK